MNACESYGDWSKNPSFDDPEVQAVFSLMTGKVAKKDRQLEEVKRELEEVKMRLAIQRENSHLLGRKVHSLYMQIDRVAGERDSLRKERELILKT
jgi:hypothetical protein